MSLDLLDFNTQNPNDYRAMIDESINLFRQAPISSTVAAGTSGQDYEVADWAPLTITDGLIYVFRAHIDNIGALSIKHGATTYDVILPVSGDDPAAHQVREGKLYFVQRNGADLVLLNPEPIQYSEFNFLINPEFAILQRGANASVNDDTYVHDRWYVLSDGNGIVGVDTGSTTATGAKTTALFASPSGTDAKFGYAQIISSELTTALRGSVASLSARLLEIGATSLADFKMAIIEWTGTADSVTSDFISSWNGAGVDPTLIANAAYCGTPVAFSSSASVVTKLENASISSGANNLIVFFWYNNTSLGVTDQIHLIMPKLQEGPRCTPFTLSKRPIQQEIDLCGRYYQKSYDLSVTPGTITTGGATGMRLASAGTLMLAMEDILSPRMRAAPTVTWYSPNSGASANIYNITDNADRAVSSSSGTGERSTGWPVLSASQTDGDGLSGQWTADAEL